MKIQLINKHHQNFNSLYITELNPKYFKIKNSLIKELENYETDKMNLDKIGEGLSGETYRFKKIPLKDLVIKSNKNHCIDNYKEEFDNLMSIPTDKIGGQEAVARIYNDTTNKYYLISTLVEGKTASVNNQYSEKHFRSLFDKMFELDKLGIYHGDLNGKNILLNKFGEVNFIDYQWTQIVPKSNFYDTEKMRKMLLPRSVFPENAQMFEMASIPYYIENLWTTSDKLNFIRKYLSTKSNYHARRAEFISQLAPNWYSFEQYLIRQSHEEEKAKAKIFKNPSDTILKLELKKIQFLSDYRDAYAHVDTNIPNRNILASPSAYLCSLSAIQDFRKSVYNELAYCFDSDLKIYLKSLMTYGDYWYNNLLEYTSDTFDYIMRAAQNTPNSYEKKHKFYINDRNPRDIKENRDILKGLPYAASFQSNFNTPYGLQLLISDLYKEPVKKMLNHLSCDRKSLHQIDKITSILKTSLRFNNDEKYLDLLNVSELAVLKIREFDSYVRHNSSSYIAKQITSDLLKDVTTFVENLFSYIYSGLKYNTADNIIVKGYKNMRKFKAKL